MNPKVNRPKHYQTNKGFQVIDVIDAFELNFNLGNVLKYVCRAGNKTTSLRDDDLKKALWYLTREVYQNSSSQSDNLEGLARYTNND